MFKEIFTEGTISSDIAQATSSMSLQKKECPCKKDPTSEACKKKLQEADKYDRLIKELESSLKRLKNSNGDETGFNAVLKYIESEIKRYKKS